MAAPRFIDGLNAQISNEFAAPQQYIANAVYYDARRSPGSRPSSTRRPSRSATTR